MPPEKKRRKADSTDSDPDDDMEEWVRCDGLILTKHNRHILLSGQMLSDKHIDFAHSLLRSQFPRLNGLQSILLQTRSKTFKSDENAIQIIHSCRNHWTTLHCNPGRLRSLVQYMNL